MTQQLALDFSTGAGADVSAFDGFLIPSFVEGGLLKPLDEVAGADVNNWEGWSHISGGSKILVNGLPMGSAVNGPMHCEAIVRGAKNVLVWIDGNGTLTQQEIDADDWRGELALLHGGATFIRAEIVAKASRERLLEEFKAAAMEDGGPRGSSSPRTSATSRCGAPFPTLSISTRTDADSSDRAPEKPGNTGANDVI